MKKLVVAIATVLCAGAVLAGAVSANPDAGRVVEEGFACGILDADGNVVITTNSKLTLYQTKVVLRCSGEVTPPDDAAVIWNYDNTGITCGLLEFGSTTTWTNKVGLGGLSQLVCTGAVNGASAASAGAGIG